MKIVIYLYCYDAFLFKNASAFLLRDLCYTMHSILLHVTSYYLFPSILLEERLFLPLPGD